MSDLPSYVAAAKPVPWANRTAWYKTIAPTYAGIMLWFVFWQDLVKGNGTPGGVLSVGLGPALLGLVIAALICHFFFYLVPGLLGQQTGLPLYVVGTSTYGVRGGLFMPGLLMGLLQFGWLAVNAWAVAELFCTCLGWNAAAPSWSHGAVATLFAVICAFVGLKGIKYVARVATYLPLIPLVVLVVLLVQTSSGLKDFNNEKVIARADTVRAATQTDAQSPDKAKSGPEIRPLENKWDVIQLMIIYVVGFFATAGAAGADIASNARNKLDVHLGSLVGVVLATIVAGGAALLVVAGAYGSIDPLTGRGLIALNHPAVYNPVKLIPDILGPGTANLVMIALAVSSFPAACFSAFIAANCFKTTMPKVNPFVSVGIGTAVAVLLAVTGIVAKVIWVFVVIGASFGPVCGAMLADYWLSGCKWSGPRASFNPAGWISWIVGFGVGAFNMVVEMLIPYTWATNAMPHLAEWKNWVPVPPVAAMVVGLVLYLVLSLIGLRTRKLEMPQQPAG